MTQPRVIMASTSVYSAINWAPMVSSKVPGTRLTMMCFSVAPYFSRVDVQPSRSLSVISLFHSATTTPNFIDLAEGISPFTEDRFCKFVAIIAVYFISKDTKKSINLAIDTSFYSGLKNLLV